MTENGTELLLLCCWPYVEFLLASGCEAAACWAHAVLWLRTWGVEVCTCTARQSFRQR